MPRTPISTLKPPLTLPTIRPSTPWPSLKAFSISSQTLRFSARWRDNMMPPPSLLRGIEINIDIVADFDADVALAVGELVDGDLSFGLVTDIDQHMSRRDTNHPSFDHTAGFYRAQALFKHRFEFAGAACRCAWFLFVPVQP